MADLTYTGWSSVKSLDVYRASGALLSSDAYNWKDTLRVGVGANYKLDPNTKLRFGLAFDQTPSNDVNRTPRLPDQDRTWLALGVQYKMSQSGTMDVGYAHEFFKDATVNNAAAAGRLIGTFNVKADILSVQYSHRF
jgi:long-chain fatty acid transport protein